jgi:hypothetical protein
MTDLTLGSVPTSGENTSSSQDSNNAAAIALLVVGVTAVAGTYYVVRRGIDRRIVKKIKEHLNKEK